MGRPIDPYVYDRELIRRQNVDKIYRDHEEDQETAKLQKLTDLRDEFIKLADRKVRAKVARNKVRDDMLIYSIGVEQRRERFGHHSAFVFVSGSYLLWNYIFLRSYPHTVVNNKYSVDSA